MKLFKAISPAQNLLLLMAWASVFLSAIAQVWMAGEGDKKRFLLSSRLLSEGKKLYVNIFEVSPPMIFYLQQLPVRLSNLIHYADYTWLVLIELVLVVIVLAMCNKLLKLHAAFAGGASARHMHTLLLAAVLVFWANSVYFADREHIFFVAVLPYLLRSMPGLSRAQLSRSFSFGIGLLAAIGFCIKPHCMILFFAVQLLTLINERSLRSVFRPENIIIALAWLLYIATTAFFWPEYFSVILPMAFATYGATKNTSIVLLLYMPPLLNFAISFAEFRKHATPYRADIYYLLGLCIAALGYVIANNGWLYTFYPLNSLIFIAIGWVWFEYVWLKKQGRERGEKTIAYTRGIYACGVIIAFNIFATLLPYIVMFTTAQLVTMNTKVQVRFAQIMKEQHYTSFGALPAASTPWSRLAEASHASFATRFQDLWMLPKFIIGGDAFRTQHESVVGYVAKAYADDLNTNKPQVIFVDVSPEYAFTKKPIDLISFLGTYPEFRDAWSHYTLLEKIDDCEEIDERWKTKPRSMCAYAVFKREP